MYVGERFNAYSHLLGALLATVGCVLLLTKAAASSAPLSIISAAAYGACLIVLYVGSTVYNSVRQSALKNALQKFDHCAIYLLIAGSYTPFSLITLNGAWGWSLFGVSWGLAAFGIVQELTVSRNSEKRLLSMLVYVVMGWMVLVAIYPLFNTLSGWGLFWLALGGVLYSGGIYWFINDDKIKHGHGIWHVFVLLGSLAQFISIYFYVI